MTYLGLALTRTTGAQECRSLVRIEVEVDRLELAFSANVDVVPLDNMPVERLKQALAMVDGWLIAQTVPAMAAT